MRDLSCSSSFFFMTFSRKGGLPLVARDCGGTAVGPQALVDCSERVDGRRRDI
jgi:hypothetical protein